MKRIYLILFILFVNTSLLSQTVVLDSVRSVNCYENGSISLLVNDIDNHLLEWYFLDDTLGWIIADTILGFNHSHNYDTISTPKCGTYKVNILNNAMILTDIAQFWIGCPLGIIPDHENIRCHGDSTGMLKRVAHSGVEPYYYEWFINNTPFTSGINDTFFNNLTAGVYKVLVTDFIGCQDSITANIVSPTEIIIDTMYSTFIECRGTNTGTSSFLISGGKPYINLEYYDIYITESQDTLAQADSLFVSNNFSSTINPVYIITISNLYASEYTINIVDSFGCLLSENFTISEPSEYIVFGSTTNPLICESDSGYFMIDSILGGGNINYGFIDSSLDSIYVTAGTYNIFIEDLDFGCIDTVPVECNALYEISVYSSINNIVCYGDSSGSILIDSISGGNYPYDIQWGGLNPLFLTSDTYSVLFVDDIGCIHEEEFIVSQPDPFSANAILYPPSCNGANDGSIAINVTGGTGNLTYFWLNGTGSIDSLYSLSAGTYSLVVSDSINCIDTIHILLEDPPLLTFSFLNFDQNLSCYGESTTGDLLISGGTQPYNISWDDGSTDIQRTLDAGTYICEIIDINGCFTQDTLIITQPDSLSVDLNVEYFHCDSSLSMASINISGGVEPFNIFWIPTGETSLVINNLTPGTYTVTVTDACGNFTTAGFVIDPFFLETSLYYDDITHIGSIEVDNSSTGGPFSYQWTDILGNIISLDDSSGVLCEETYFVTVTDSSSYCTNTDTLEAYFYLPLGDILDVTTTTVYADSLLWGFGPYTYLWSNGDTAIHSDVCPTDDVPLFVEVTDINGCYIISDFTDEIENLIITLDPSSAILECNLENLDVDLEASATGGTTGGTGIYYFEWFNGSTENPINLGLNPGNFGVTVTDDNGCTEDTTFMIATITAECVPNIFTPNGDNINDVWNLEDTFLYEDSEIKIYGKYGRLLFSSLGYEVPWDGNNKKGNPVPEGVYFYAIQIGHGFDDIKGTVTIIR